ncbi:ATP-binding protein [Polaribacter batillariae]|uniref:ATP-binding protein n=1 Tax=Polaribacter batillariae TaxID=2808900 RepID=A0ABX7SQB3_9FLAO|nr:ATP-binding protein [Polaribacter batillariae]QTD36311.1 ATP-binding protein [Polaribacter batillariae]
MEETILQQKNEIVALYKEKLLSVFLEKITEHHKTMQKIEQLQKNLVNKTFTTEEDVAIKELDTYKEALDNVVSSYFSKINSNEELLFNDYFTSLDAYLETLHTSITRTQDKERFFGLETDSKTLKFKKSIKRSLFNISKIPLKTANIFRKTKKEVVFWQQEIPFKNATSYYFKGELIKSLATAIDAIHKEISEITNIYWKIDHGIDEAIKLLLSDKKELSFSEDLFDTLKEVPSLESRIEHHKLAFAEIFEATALQYTDALYKADTFELPAHFFNTNKIANYQKEVFEKSQKEAKLWQNTFSVLESDWELDIEIFKIIFSVLFKYDVLERSINKRSEVVKNELENIKTYLFDVKSTISKAKTKADIKSAFVNELKNVNKHFKKTIEETSIRITNLELPLQINQFEENVLQVLKTLSTKRAISSDMDFSTKTATSAINYISPYELVTYQSWPSLLSTIKQAKVDLNVKVTSFIDDINALAQVSEFNLESALSLFDNDTEDSISTENSPKKVALEGLERSEEKIEELKNTLAHLNVSNGKLLLPSINKFNQSILELTDTENILEIRLSIAKAKSIEKSKLLKEKVINNVKNFVPVAINYSKNKYTKTARRVKNLLIRTGLYKEIADVNSDLSDFLKQAEQALDELPYVYQRLFRSETLQNETLFIGRTEALQSLDVAYNSFGKNHYAATVIVGERGSGKTSLIHYFLNQHKKMPKTIFLSSKQNISEPIDFIAFLKTSFKKDLDTIEDWIAFFNNGKKKIIILEDLQYLYFRKVGGFNVLYLLSNLIASTKKNVFWIVTSSKYAFQYLDKSIQISELFAFQIEMNEIDKQTITEALIKRHKISGYNLHFEKPPVAYLTKKFLKSPVEVQQEILKEDFFSDINKIAQSNFRIAFMYWIRSTVKVSGSTIYMRSLKSINTSFLNKLAPIKLLMLNSILLQERLTIEDILQLSSLNEQHTKNIVHALYEKGLLTMENEEFYTINIFLYRQITTLLKSKNVIH